jgi:hypothetical protein
MSENGILATKFIPSDIKQQNDKARLDNAEDYVCCSLQYPNCWYWNKAKIRDDDVIFREWVVLIIDLAILKESAFKFSSCNAAKSHGEYISDDLNKIADLFAEGGYRKPNMLSCCPSDDQAEILVYENIPLDYVNGIIVGDNDNANNIASILKTVNKKIPIYVSAPVCNTEWSSMVRRGEKPTETEYKY